MGFLALLVPEAVFVTWIGVHDLRRAGRERDGFLFWTGVDSLVPAGLAWMFVGFLVIAVVAL